MRISHLSLQNWRQFDGVDIEFHPKLTILTGANGSGKTSVLRILARHFQWEYQELASPVKDVKTGEVKFLVPQEYLPEDVPMPQTHIGNVRYEPDEQSHRIMCHSSNAPTYSMIIERMPNLRGSFIPSHRPEFQYRQMSSVSMENYTSQQSFDRYSISYRQRAMHGNGEPAIYFIKETLMQWIYSSDTTERIEGDQAKKRMLEGYEEILSKILPATLGFKKIMIRSSEIILVTESGNFAIDASSGGIAALIDLSWHIYLLDPTKTESLTVLIDEAENHLHAVMQRLLLNGFIGAFPNVQFIVSTHSPLVVGSVKDSKVYVLHYNSQRKVVSEELDFINRAGTASEILRNVLGVPVTIPVWAESFIDDVVHRYQQVEPSTTSFSQLRVELASQGLEEFAPEVIANVVNSRILESD